MSVIIIKNFGPIRDEYLFFEEHATEAAEDVRAYLPHLHALATASGPIRMLDFGAGSGRFSCQFLALARFPQERLWLSLVEPEEGYRQQAIAQLQPFTAHPVQAWPALLPYLEAHFALVLANHVFYYVPNLEAVLAGIRRALTPSGLFLTAMAGQSNLLIQFWNSCFAFIGPAGAFTQKQPVLKEGEVQSLENLRTISLPLAQEGKLLCRAGLFLCLSLSHKRPFLRLSRCPLQTAEQ